MDSLQIASAVADTTKTSAPSSGEGWGTRFLWLVIGALIATFIALFKDWFKQTFEKLWSQRGSKSRYLEWVVSEHRHLNIAGLKTHSPVEVELESVYVSLAVDRRSLSQMGVEEEEIRRKRPRAEDLLPHTGHEEKKGITIADALKLIDDEKVSGLVILGGPGTGKTTVLKYLALTYARGLHGERLDQPRHRIPIFVPLHTVTADRCDHSLIDYLAGVCNAAGCRASSDFFERRLQNGDCIVLLDGLDEVADETQRKQVAAWVAAQCRTFHRNPFVVTCRVAGFREEYLPLRFLRLEVQDFDEEDVRQFARNWCLAVETMLSGSSDEARRKGEKASEELIRAVQANDRVKALAVNPLLLSIIALVHRYRAKLPDRRVDLYAECVEVLLGHWDQAKDIPVPIPPGKSLQVLQPLALWMHEQKQGEEGERVARRDEIEKLIAPYLAGIGVGKAGTFLDSIRDRSGLLVERGLDLFGFQHQTFQEYLAAREIAERGRLDLLVARFGDSYWQEVTLLCAGIRDASALLTGILSLPDERVTEHWRLVLQVLDESLFVDEDARRAVFVRPLEILKQSTDPVVAARASLWLRRGMPDVETLIQAFEEAQGELAKGHLALLLGETGDSRAVEALKPHLTGPDPHVRYLCALALDLLGYENRQVLDDLLMVRVPVGEFIMGGEKYSDEKPVRRVETGAFLIDRFPLTNGQYKRFIEAGGYQERQYWSEEGWKWKEEGKVSEPEEWRDLRFNLLSAPVVGISWYEAQAYANWAGKRLPTEQEWERTARGDQDARVYPWGDEFEESRGNTDEGGINQPTPVGSYPGGVSPHGCYDMAGNVCEWTQTAYERVDEEDRKWWIENYAVPEWMREEPFRVLRGGSWFSGLVIARCAYRLRLPPVDRPSDVGVRFSRTS